MSDTPDWESWDSAHGCWTVLSTSNAILLETAFRDPSVRTTSVAGLVFNVNDMHYPPSNPVRRSKCDAPDACMYHDGYAFMKLNSYSSTLILDAKHYGRSQTSFYINDTDAYDVSLTDPATQTNRLTGTNRALHIPKIPDNGGDDDVEDEDEDREVNQELLDKVDSMPEEFSATLMCPITTQLMRKPMVASDHHTYERWAIVRWMKKNDTSPMTGAPMGGKSLRFNHNIKQQLDWLRESVKPEPSVASASRGKRNMDAGPDAGPDAKKTLRLRA